MSPRAHMPDRTHFPDTELKAFGVDGLVSGYVVGMWSM